MNCLKRLQRFLAGFVVVTFFVTNTLTPTPVAYGQTVENFSKFFAENSFKIPAEFGKVTDIVKNPEGSPLLIHIQEAHANYDAQNNIRNILQYLAKDYDVKLVLLEGAGNKLTPELLKFFPQNTELQQAINEKLMRAGELTGAETMLINSGDKKVEGWGIENAGAYAKDREAYRKVSANRTILDQFLSNFYLAWQKQAGLHIEKDFREFLGRFVDFEEARFPLQDWLGMLKSQTAKTFGLDLSNVQSQLQWPVLVRYFRLRSLEGKIDLQKVEKEKKEFLDEIQRILKIRSPKLDDLVSNIEVIFKSAKKRDLPIHKTRFVFERLMDVLPKDFSFDAYPNLRLYIQQMILMSELQGEMLQKEIQELTKRLVETMAKSEEEKRLAGALREYRLLTKLFHLELSREEYQQVKSRGITPGDLLARLQSQYSSIEAERKLGQPRLPSIERKQKPGQTTDQRPETENKGLESLFATAMQFYAGAINREDFMMQRAREIMRERKTDKAVIVTGGFHADGFKQKITASGSSYIAIMPAIGEITADSQKNYLTALLGSSAISNSHIAPEMITQPSFFQAVSPRFWRREFAVRFVRIRDIIRQTIASFRDRAAENKAEFDAGFQRFIASAVGVSTQLQPVRVAAHSKAVVRSETRAEKQKDKKPFTRTPEGKTIASEEGWQRYVYGVLLMDPIFRDRILGAASPLKGNFRIILEHRNPFRAGFLGYGELAVLVERKNGKGFLAPATVRNMESMALRKAWSWHHIFSYREAEQAAKKAGAAFPRRSEIRESYETRRAALEQMAQERAFVPLLGFAAVKLYNAENNFYRVDYNRHELRQQSEQERNHRAMVALMAIQRDAVLGIEYGDAAEKHRRLLNLPNWTLAQLERTERFIRDTGWKPETPAGDSTNKRRAELRKHGKHGGRSYLTFSPPRYVISPWVAGIVWVGVALILLISLLCYMSGVSMMDLKWFSSELFKSKPKQPVHSVSPTREFVQLQLAPGRPEIRSKGRSEIRQQSEAELKRTVAALYEFYRANQFGTVPLEDGKLILSADTADSAVLLIKPPTGLVTENTLLEALREAAKRGYRPNAMRVVPPQIIKEQRTIAKHYPRISEVADNGTKALTEKGELELVEKHLQAMREEGYGFAHMRNLYSAKYLLRLTGLSPRELTNLFKGAYKAKEKLLRPVKLERFEKDPRAFRIAPVTIPDEERIPAAFRGKTVMVFNGFFHVLEVNFEETKYSTIAIWLKKYDGAENPATLDQMKFEYAGETDPAEAAAKHPQSLRARAYNHDPALELDYPNVKFDVEWNFIHFTASEDVTTWPAGTGDFYAWFDDLMGRAETREYKGIGMPNKLEIRPKPVTVDQLDGLVDLTIRTFPPYRKRYGQKILTWLDSLPGNEKNEALINRTKILLGQIITVDEEVDSVLSNELQEKVSVLVDLLKVSQSNRRETKGSTVRKPAKVPTGQKPLEKADADELLAIYKGLLPENMISEPWFLETRLHYYITDGIGNSAGWFGMVIENLVRNKRSLKEFTDELLPHIINDIDLAVQVLDVFLRNTTGNFKMSKALLSQLSERLSRGGGSSLPLQFFFYANEETKALKAFLKEHRDAIEKIRDVLSNSRDRFQAVRGRIASRSETRDAHLESLLADLERVEVSHFGDSRLAEIKRALWTKNFDGAKTIARGFGAIDPRDAFLKDVIDRVLKLRSETRGEPVVKFQVGPHRIEAWTREELIQGLKGWQKLGLLPKESDQESSIEIDVASRYQEQLVQQGIMLGPDEFLVVENGEGIRLPWNDDEGKLTAWLTKVVPLKAKDPMFKTVRNANTIQIFRVDGYRKKVAAAPNPLTLGKGFYFVTVEPGDLKSPLNPFGYGNSGGILATSHAKNGDFSNIMIAVRGWGNENGVPVDEPEVAPTASPLKGPAKGSGSASTNPRAEIRSDRHILTLLAVAAKNRPGWYPFARVAAGFVSAKGDISDAISGNDIPIDVNAPGLHEHSEMNLLLQVLGKASVIVATDKQDDYKKRLDRIRELIRTNKLNDSEDGMRDLQEALNLAGNPFENGTLYVTLMPCNNCQAVLKTLKLSTIVYDQTHPLPEKAEKWLKTLEKNFPQEDPGVTRVRRVEVIKGDLDPNVLWSEMVTKSSEGTDLFQDQYRAAMNASAEKGAFSFPSMTEPRLAHNQYRIVDIVTFLGSVHSVSPEDAQNLFDFLFNRTYDKTNLDVLRKYHWLTHGYFEYLHALRDATEDADIVVAIKKTLLSVADSMYAIQHLLGNDDPRAYVQARLLNSFGFHPVALAEERKEAPGDEAAKSAAFLKRYKQALAFEYEAYHQRVERGEDQWIIGRLEAFRNRFRGQILEGMGLERYPSIRENLLLRTDYWKDREDFVERNDTLFSLRSIDIGGHVIPESFILHAWTADKVMLVHEVWPALAAQILMNIAWREQLLAEYQVASIFTKQGIPVGEQGEWINDPTLMHNHGALGRAIGRAMVDRNGLWPVIFIEWLLRHFDPVLQHAFVFSSRDHIRDLCMLEFETHYGLTPDEIEQAVDGIMELEAKYEQRAAVIRSGGTVEPDQDERIFLNSQGSRAEIRTGKQMTRAVRRFQLDGNTANLIKSLAFTGQQESLIHYLRDIGKGPAQFVARQMLRDPRSFEQVMDEISLVAVLPLIRSALKAATRSEARAFGSEEEFKEFHAFFSTKDDRNKKREYAKAMEFLANQFEDAARENEAVAVQVFKKRYLSYLITYIPPLFVRESKNKNSLRNILLRKAEETGMAAFRDAAYLIAAPRQAELEKQFRSSGKSRRKQAAEELSRMIQGGEIYAVPLSRNNNVHVHSKYSYSPYYPEEIAYHLRLGGHRNGGIIDHDTTAGNLDFLAAAKIFGLKSTSGFEMRVNLTGIIRHGIDLGKLVINNPGVVNMVYFLCHALPDPNHPLVKELLEKCRASKERRNRAMMVKVNEKLRGLGIPVQMDYDRHILGDERIEVQEGNVTDRHLMVALARLLGEDTEAYRKIFSRDEKKVAKAVAGAQADDFDVPMGLLREAFLKPGVGLDCFIEADEDENPPMEKVVKIIKAAGGIPIYPYLGDLSTQEDQNLEALFEYLAEIGVEGIAIMPHRNTDEQIKRAMQLAEKVGLKVHRKFRVFSGVDINKPDMPFLEERGLVEVPPGLPPDEFIFDPAAAASFLDGGDFLIGHEIFARATLSPAANVYQNLTGFGFYHPDVIEEIPDGETRFQFFRRIGGLSFKDQEFLFEQIQGLRSFSTAYSVTEEFLRKHRAEIKQVATSVRADLKIQSLIVHEAFAVSLPSEGRSLRAKRLLGELSGALENDPQGALAAANDLREEVESGTTAAKDLTELINVLEERAASSSRAETREEITLDLTEYSIQDGEPMTLAEFLEAVLVQTNGVAEKDLGRYQLIKVEFSDSPGVPEEHRNRHYGFEPIFLETVDQDLKAMVGVNDGAFFHRVVLIKETVVSAPVVVPPLDSPQKNASPRRVLGDPKPGPKRILKVPKNMPQPRMMMTGASSQPAVKKSSSKTWLWITLTAAGLMIGGIVLAVTKPWEKQKLSTTPAPTPAQVQSSPRSEMRQSFTVTGDGKASLMELIMDNIPETLVYGTGRIDFDKITRITYGQTVREFEGSRAENVRLFFAPTGEASQIRLRAGTQVMVSYRSQIQGTPRNFPKEKVEDNLLRDEVAPIVMAAAGVAMKQKLSFEAVLTGEKGNELLPLQGKSRAEWESNAELLIRSLESGYDAEKRFDLWKITRPNGITVQITPRSEIRDVEAKPIWMGLDSSSADWTRMNLIVSILLDLFRKTGSPMVEKQCFQTEIFNKLIEMELDIPKLKVEELLGALVREGVLIQSEDSFGLAVSPEVAAIQADDPYSIKTDLESKMADDSQLKEMLLRYSEASKNWPLYSLESQWPALRALTLLSKDDQKKVIRIMITHLDEFGGTRLADAALLMLGDELLAPKEMEDYIKRWMKRYTPELIGRDIYYVSPETWILAGGLGRVGQFHVKAILRLLAKQGRIVTIEGFYHYRIAADGSKTPIDYAKLEMPVLDMETVYEFETTVHGKKVPVVVKKGKTKDGTEGLFLDGGEYYTGALYKYGGEYNACTWAEYTEFFSRASLELIRILETIKQKRDGEAYKPPVIWGNDGQTGFLPVYKKMLDKVIGTLRKAVVWFTTHTFKNRSQGGWGDFGGAGLTEQPYSNLVDKSGNPDATSGGVRGADGRNAVAAAHRHEVSKIDPQSRMVSIGNGDDLEGSSAYFRGILREIYPEVDVWNPEPEQILAAKKEGIRRLNPELKTKYGVEFDSEAPVICYTGRFVSEKSGRKRAWVNHNIRRWLESGANIAYFANVQRPNDNDFAEMQKFAKEMNAEIERKEKTDGKKYGRIIVATGWNRDEQVKILGISHIGIFDSDYKTGASEITEANLSVNGGLILGPAWIEGNIQKIGLLLDPAHPGRGSILVPRNESSEAYRDVVLREMKRFFDKPHDFGMNAARAISSSRLVNALLPGAQYLIEFNETMRHKKNLSLLLDAVRTDRQVLASSKVKGTAYAKGLRKISSMTRDEAIDAFGEEKLFAVMSLVVFLLPDTLTKFQNWGHPDFPMLERYLNDPRNQGLFADNASVRIHTTSDPEVLMLSRSGDGVSEGRVLTPFIHLGNPWGQRDGKVWVQEIQNIGRLIPHSDAVLRVGDYSIPGKEVHFYDKKPTATELLTGYRAGIPVEDHFSENANIPHRGLHAQLLFLEEETAQRAEIRVGSLANSKAFARDIVRGLQDGVIDTGKSNQLIELAKADAGFAAFTVGELTHARSQAAVKKLNSDADKEALRISRAIRTQRVFVRAKTQTTSILSVSKMPFTEEVFLSETQGMELLQRLLKPGETGQIRYFPSFSERTNGRMIAVIRNREGAIELDLSSFETLGGYTNFIVEKNGSITLLKWSFGDGRSLEKAAKDLVRVEDLDVFFEKPRQPRRAETRQDVQYQDQVQVVNPEEWFSPKDIYHQRVPENLARVVTQPKRAKKPVLLQAVSNSPAKDALLTSLGFVPVQTKDRNSEEFAFLAALPEKLAADAGAQFARQGKTVTLSFSNGKQAIFILADGRYSRTFENFINNGLRGTERKAGIESFGTVVQSGNLSLKSPAANVPFVLGDMAVLAGKTGLAPDLVQASVIPQTEYDKLPATKPVAKPAPEPVTAPKPVRKEKPAPKLPVVQQHIRERLSSLSQEIVRLRQGAASPQALSVLADETNSVDRTLEDLLVSIAGEKILGSADEVQKLLSQHPDLKKAHLTPQKLQQMIQERFTQTYRREAETAIKDRFKNKTMGRETLRMISEGLDQIEKKIGTLSQSGTVQTKDLALLLQKAERLYQAITDYIAMLLIAEQETPGFKVPEDVLNRLWFLKGALGILNRVAPLFLGFVEIGDRGETEERLFDYRGGKAEGLLWEKDLSDAQLLKATESLEKLGRHLGEAVQAPQHSQPAAYVPLVIHVLKDLSREAAVLSQKRPLSGIETVAFGYRVLGWCQCFLGPNSHPYLEISKTKIIEASSLALELPMIFLQEPVSSPERAEIRAGTIEAFLLDNEIPTMPYSDFIERYTRESHASEKAMWRLTVEVMNGIAPLLAHTLNAAEAVIAHLPVSIAQKAEDALMKARFSAARTVLGIKTIQAGDAFILGREFALGQGFLAAVKDILGDAPVAVIARDAKDRAFVDQFNAGLAPDRQIIIASETDLKNVRIALRKQVKTDRMNLKALLYGAETLKDPLSDITVQRITPRMFQNFLSLAGERVSSLVTEIQARFEVLHSA